MSQGPTSTPQYAQQYPGQPLTQQPLTQQPFPPQGLPPQGYGQQMYVRPLKSVGVAYVLWFFFGLLGIHQYYMGKIGRGVLYTLTCGVCGIAWFIDLFTLASQVRRINAEIVTGVR